MIKVFKLILGLFLVAVLAVVLVNSYDANPSKDLKKYQSLKTNHMLTPTYVSARSFLEQISTLKEIQKLRLSLKKPSLICFANSTCSDKDFNKALEVVPQFLETNQETLNRFQDTISKINAISIPPYALISENLFFSLDTLITLQLIEINHFFSKLNRDKSFAKKALAKAMALDRFIVTSLGQPNFTLTSLFLISRLQWLRSSIQKYSPTKTSLPKINVLDVIEQVKLGEFIVFSNTLEDLLKNKSTDKLKNIYEFYTPTLFISKNRTLNLYVELKEKHSKAPCIFNEEIRFCKEYPLNYMQPINPAGRAFVQLVTASPLHLKKIVTLAKEINALNL